MSEIQQLNSMAVSVYLVAGLVFSLIAIWKEKPELLTETAKLLFLMFGISIAWPYVLVRGLMMVWKKKTVKGIKNERKEVSNEN